MFWHCCQHSDNTPELARIARMLSALTQKVARLECTVMTARDDLSAQLDELGSDITRVLDEVAGLRTLSADLRTALDEALASGDLTEVIAKAEALEAAIEAVSPEPAPEEPPVEEPPVEEPPVEEPPVEEPPVEEPPTEEVPAS